MKRQFVSASLMLLFLLFMTVVGYSATLHYLRSVDNTTAVPFDWSLYVSRAIVVLTLFIGVLIGRYSAREGQYSPIEVRNKEGE